MLGFSAFLWLVDGSFLGLDSPSSAHAAGTHNEWQTAASALDERKPVIGEASVAIFLGALGFSGLALFNRHLRKAGTARIVASSQRQVS